MDISKSKKLIVSAVAAVLGLAAMQANSATVSRAFAGNDCSGYFGQGFESCTIFVNDEGETIELSPVIAKFESDEGLVLDDLNTALYPSVDGSEFSFSNTSAGNDSGDWAYAPGVDDPGVRYWATKSGDGFLLTWEVADADLEAGGVCDVADVYVLGCLDAALIQTSGSWATEGQELSHITFYDTAVIPVPAAFWLFGSALGFLGWSRRKAR